MNSQSQAKSPERLRAMVAGTLANFQHPTLKHNLTTLKALHHVAWLDRAALGIEHLARHELLACGIGHGLGLALVVAGERDRRCPGLDADPVVEADPRPVGGCARVAPGS